ncbi:MAG TPA: beta-galactosidase GalB [Opitutales bacterium]|nr:beta-galactosidase GalB [Opitutales bacterium]
MLPALAAAALALVAPAAYAQPGLRDRVNFDANWRFLKEDAPDANGALAYPQIKGDLLANANFADYVVRPTADHTPGENISFAKPDFDDSSWRLLNLPQDWGVEAPFDMSLNASTGRLPYFGTAWYRKHFTVPASAAGQRTLLDVDGAMSYASIWLNGHFIGGWPYGYSSFQADLTPYLKPGADNVIAIRLDNPNNSSRWYPGGGIYRNVWLETVNPVHTAHWSTFVTTPEITAQSATVNLKTEIYNESAAPTSASVNVDIYALDASGQITGQPVARGSAPAVNIAAGAIQPASLNLTVADPKLWDIDHPNLYAAVTSIEQNGKAVDTTRTNFGIRTIKFDPNGGFFLNGQHVRLNGVCDHADLGPLGSVVNTRGLERQIQILKEMGCNAIRTSHNPPAPELLDLCDRLGMVVMDEAFDTWDRSKTRNDYNQLWADWHTADVRAYVRRDRNHPCVILYSVGNEIGDQGSQLGNNILYELIKTVHAEDSTRLVDTNNSSNNGFTSYPEDEYVFGFSYEPRLRPNYATYHEQRPNVVLVGSESASCISSRGVYVFPVTDTKGGGAMPNHLMSSYDLYAPPWANIPDVEFADQDKNPNVAGEFVWTGFDYLGEPTNNGRSAGGRRGAPPPTDASAPAPDTSRSSYFGIIDLDGFKKDRFFIYQARWRPDYPMAHILPHWNWAGREGQVTPVHVYTSGDSAELFLNGKSLGKKTKGQYEYRLRWDDVTYEPGTLHVVAYKDGKVWAEDTVKTTGDAAKVDLVPDHATIASDGADISYVTVSIKDKDGLTVPTAMNDLHYEISGPGEIVAVDNGDETSLAPLQGSKDSKAFNGLALVIVRAKPGQSGKITLTATSPNLATATTTITAK